MSAAAAQQTGAPVVVAMVAGQPGAGERVQGPLAARLQKDAPGVSLEDLHSYALVIQASYINRYLLPLAQE